MDLQKTTVTEKAFSNWTFPLKKEKFSAFSDQTAPENNNHPSFNGLYPPEFGTAFIEGMDCFRQHPEIQKRLGYLPGEIALMDGMSGIGYLNFMADMKNIRDKSRMKELMDYFELDPKGSIRKMSKGMKQKLAIICAFMQNPEILILDEPTSGLDPLMQKRFIDLVLDFKKKGATVLLSSHIFEEVEKSCDRTAIIRKGKLVAIENMNSLAEKKKKPIL